MQKPYKKNEEIARISVPRFALGNVQRCIRYQKQRIRDSNLLPFTNTNTLVYIYKSQDRIKGSESKDMMLHQEAP